MSTALSADHLGVVYDHFHALKDVSVSIESGESFGLVGESGSGKSTLLRAVAGLAPVKNGTIKIHGAARRRGPCSCQERHDQDPRRAALWFQAQQGLLPQGPDGVSGPLRFAASTPDNRPAAAGAAGDPW